MLKVMASKVSEYVYRLAECIAHQPESVGLISPTVLLLNDLPT